MIKINKKQAQKANLSGRGGKEFILKHVFTVDGVECKRVNKPLYDFTQGNHRLEFKKQSNTQWFDVGKYHNLKQNDEDIDMVFIVTSKGKADNLPQGQIIYIAVMRLGTMLNLLLNTSKYNQLGWTKENLKTCYEQKLKYPTQQAKVKLNVRNFLRENKSYMKALFVNKELGG
tara:strand:- start:876 stop:1394 length:519 start_codon:yes stop_codon:yes gene_type:complete